MQGDFSSGLELTNEPSFFQHLHPWDFPSPPSNMVLSFRLLRGEGAGRGWNCRLLGGGVGDEDAAVLSPFSIVISRKISFRLGREKGTCDRGWGRRLRLDSAAIFSTFCIWISQISAAADTPRIFYLLLSVSSYSCVLSLAGYHAMRKFQTGGPKKFIV